MMVDPSRDEATEQKSGGATSPGDRSQPTSGAAGPIEVRRGVRIVLPPETESGDPGSNESGEAADEPIRVGSPFAIDPAELTPTPAENSDFAHWSPINYTALGAVAASAMTLIFAAAGAWWFPSGGVLTAALGCALASFGLTSPRRRSAALLLATHLALFLLSYGRVFV